MDLLERFARGDLEAFEILFREFQGRVYAWIFRYVRDSGVAEDLTIETFWRIYRSRQRFDPERDFGGWAHRIALNLAFGYLRRAPQPASLMDDPPQRTGADPALQREERETILRAFLNLPMRLQLVAAMALIEERPYEEIARELQIPLGTVKSRVWRATKILRKKLAETGIRQ